VSHDVAELNFLDGPDQAVARGESHGRHDIAPRSSCRDIEIEGTGSVSAVNQDLTNIPTRSAMSDTFGHTLIAPKIQECGEWSCSL
jgi:hypothetical protein